MNLSEKQRYEMAKVLLLERVDYGVHLWQIAFLLNRESFVTESGEEWTEDAVRSFLETINE